MVYMILGTGFEPMEAIAPCDILRRGGVEVQLAGIGGTLIEAGHGVRVQADCRVEDLKLASTDMVILPGGLGGVHSILACDTAMNFIRLAYEDGKYIAAICAAPTILAQLHITEGHLLPGPRGEDGRRRHDGLRRRAGWPRHHRPRGGLG